MLSGDHTLTPLLLEHRLTFIIPSFGKHPKWNAFSVWFQSWNDQIAWSYRYQSLAGCNWTNIDPEHFTCSLFWNQFSLCINHRDHHTLFMASFGAIIGFINQVHGTFDTLHRFRPSAVSFTGRVGWKGVNHLTHHISLAIYQLYQI